MKFSIKHSSTSKLGWLISCLAVFFLFSGCKKWNQLPVVTVTTIASGISNPSGIESDYHGNLWVSEGGTFQNDGKVWFIQPNGNKHLAIKNLSAFKNAGSDEPQGPAHLLLDRNHLFILSGDYLYRIDISHFNPEWTKPIDATKLPYEDVGGFVFSQKYTDSHAYNLSKGPDGDIYIADAGANAIIHRHGYNKFSILADIPAIKNPIPVGGPFMESVPTSILTDGQDLLVTTLTGFPFAKGAAVIYKVSLSGKVSLYQKGFTQLVDLAQGSHGHHIAVQYSTFGKEGFEHNTGALSWVNGQTIMPMVGGLDMPVGIKQHNSQTWFVTCMGDGTVKKVTYQ